MRHGTIAARTSPRRSGPGAMRGEGIGTRTWLMKKIGAEECGRKKTRREPPPPPLVAP